MSHLTFPPRKLLFSRSDKVVAERRKLLEVLVNFEHVYSTLMLLFALHNLSVNLRERGEREPKERHCLIHSLFFLYCRFTWGVYCPYFCRHQAVIFILPSVNISPSRICVIMNHFLKGVCLKRANTAQLKIQGTFRVRNFSVLACALLCLWCWIH